MYSNKRSFNEILLPCLSNNEMLILANTKMSSLQQTQSDIKYDRNLYTKLNI